MATKKAKDVHYKTEIARGVYTEEMTKLLKVMCLFLHPCKASSEHRACLMF